MKTKIMTNYLIIYEMNDFENIKLMIVTTIFINTLLREK